MNEPVQIPDFVLREIAALTLNLAAARERIAALEGELEHLAAQLRETKDE